MTKKEAREWVKAQVAILSDQYKKEANHSITEEVLESDAYQKANTIFCYVSKDDEVDTYNIIKDALSQGKRVGVPRCMDNHQMDVCMIQSFDDLEEGTWGIMEPKATCKKLRKQDIQLAIIPCLSFDLRGGRLGHGAGYYDRYLAGTKFLKLLLGYTKLSMKNVPMDDNDVWMDEIICR